MRILMVVVVLCLAIPAGATDDEEYPVFNTGNEIYEGLRVPDVHGTKSEPMELYKFGLAMGYVLACYDFISVYMGGIETGGVKTGQVSDVVKNFMKEHPEDRHRAAVVIISYAISEAFGIDEESEGEGEPNHEQY